MTGLALILVAACAYGIGYLRASLELNWRVERDIRAIYQRRSPQ